MRLFRLSPRGLALPLVALCAVAGLCFAQTTFERTYIGYSGSSVQQTSDGGYVITGGSNSGCCLIKTDFAGDTLWTRTYGSLGGGYGSSVQQTSDGGYIIAGRLSSATTPEEGPAFLVKTNSTGDTLWTKTYGGTWNYPPVEQTFDGGYIMTGYGANIQAGWSSSYLIKTSRTGEVLWRKRFTIPPEQVESFGRAYSVRQTSEGGYIIAGDCRSYVFLLKTDASGDILWTKGYFGSYDEAHAVQQTFDKGYIIAGNTAPYGRTGGDILLVRTNPRGDTLWTRTYGGPDHEYGYSVQQTSDGGFIVAGSTSAFNSWDGKEDVYLLRTNSSGDTVWTRTFGGTLSDVGYSAEQTFDGGFIIAGSTASFSADSSYRLYLIKTDANGRVTNEANAASLFSPKVDISSGSFPWSTTTEDLDGDGKVDLATPLYDGDVVALFRNVGIAGSLSQGSFAGRSTYPTGTGPTGIASADFDSDGKLDLAVSNAISGTVSLFRNISLPGTLQFASRSDFPVGKSPKGLAAGDLDGDGKADLAVPIEEDSSIIILRNTSTLGSIGFTPLPEIPVGAGPLKALLADLDQDGLADIVVVNNGSASLSLLRNVSTPGTLSFASPVPLATGSAPGRMAIADIDGDDAPDLIVDNINDGMISLYRNISTSGRLSFSPPVQFPAGNKPWCVAAGDVNGDGKTDLTVANYQDSTLAIFINRSEVGFITPGSLQNVGTLRTGANPLDVEVSDLDGDRNPDLVAACRGSNTLSLFRNVSGAVALPAPAALVAPPDNAVVGNDSVQFSWKPASAGVERYRWEVATDSLFASPVIDTVIATTSGTVRWLIGGQVYWWKVAAENATGWGPFSPINRFITLMTDIGRTQDIPHEFSLSQNYPNPFNPTTVVSSQLPVVSNVRIAIYDVLGREVAVLVNERRAAGRYVDTFDASGLASGIYICRMSAGMFVQSRKMLLIK